MCTATGKAPTSLSSWETSYFDFSFREYSLTLLGEISLYPALTSSLNGLVALSSFAYIKI